MSARKPKHSHPPAQPLSYASAHSSGNVPWHQSPIVLTVVFGLMWLFGTLLFTTTRYSSQTAMLVLYHLLIDGGTVGLWLAAAIGYGLQLLRLTHLSDTHIDPPLRLVTAAALGFGAMGLAVLELGLIGWLGRWSAIALIAIGVLILVTMVVANVPTGLKMRPRLVTPWAWSALLAVPAAVIATMAALMPAGVMWGSDEPNGYDVVEYHLQVPREWYEAHRIIPLHHNVFSFMPFNMEMHYLLAMHLRGGPWAGMYVAQLMHLTLTVLAVLAIYAVAQRVVNSPSIGVLAAVVAGTVPWLAMVGSVAYDEGAFLLYSTLAIGWAMLALGRRVPRRTSLIVAGIMAGLACGVKYTAAPEVLAAGAVGLLCVARRENDTTRMGWRLLLGGAGLYVAAGLLTFLPWLLRNELWAKNPVFPEAARLIGPGDFSPPQVERWEQAYVPKGREATAVGRGEALWGQVISDWRFGFILLPLGVAGAITGWGKPAVRFAVLQMLALLIFWIGFTHLQGRFFILAVPLCGLLLAHVPWERMAAWGHVGLATLIGLAAIGGAVGLEQQWSARVDQPPTPLISLLGQENLNWPTGPYGSAVPDDATLVLVGDAQAFFYTRPMLRLRYHTVFDLDTSDGRTLLEAYGVRAVRGVVPPGEYLLVDPGELERFEKTYQPLAPVPQTWKERKAYFLVTPGTSVK
jgi:hypothetical protein